jgi:hypothetical protein
MTTIIARGPIMTIAPRLNLNESHERAAMRQAGRSAAETARRHRDAGIISTGHFQALFANAYTQTLRYLDVRHCEELIVIFEKGVNRRLEELAERDGIPGMVAQ